jgi:hypothetical protein
LCLVDTVSSTLILCTHFCTHTPAYAFICDYCTPLEWRTRPGEEEEVALAVEEYYWRIYLSTIP